MLFTRASVWVRPSNRAASGPTVANAIAPPAPGGGGDGSGDGLSVPRERVVAGRLRSAPADDRREVATSLNGAPEVGWRGFGNLSARELHVDVVRAHERAALEVDVDDDVLNRVDVDVRPGVSGQCGDRKVPGFDNEVDRGASDTGGCAEGVRLRLCFVVVKGVRGGVGGLVGITGVGVGDGIVRPRLVTRQDLKLGFDSRRRDASLRHFRGLNESNIRNGAGGSADARRSRGWHAKKPLRHQHSRTFDYFDLEN